MVDKSYLQASEGNDKGKYNFYTSSQDLNKKIDIALYEGDSITMGTGGIASVNYSETSFSSSTDCYNFKMEVNTKILYYYLLSIKNVVNDIGFSGTGLKHLQKEFILNMPFSLPIDEEQKEIIKYLDEKTTKIDKIISKQKEVIEKLKEYRQSLITEVVTRGLNKNVIMKNSKIEWIGDIVENWRTVKIKNTSWLKGRIGWQGLQSSEYINDGPFLITGTDFNDGYINWNSCAHITEDRFEEAPEIHIKENDLLITKDGTVGKVAIAKKCPKKVSLNSGVLLIRNTKNIKYISKFLYYVLLSNEFWKWFTINLPNNSTIIHLYQEQFYNFSFALPSLKEQEKLANYLDDKCLNIYNSIQQKQSIIEKLEEYKKSLIYEYVTGKKEVEYSNNIIEFPININCKNQQFAQAILICKIIDMLDEHYLGRVKLEKIFYTLQTHVGFNFDTEYTREVAGPLDTTIYKCETIISKKNKWIKISRLKNSINYSKLDDFNKYEKYYNNYYAQYNSQIEEIVNLFKDFSMEQAEIVATLYAAWNDFIISKAEFTDLDIVNDVRNNWNDSKKRFKNEVYLRALEKMKNAKLIPNGYGKHTASKI